MTWVGDTLTAVRGLLLDRRGRVGERWRDARVGEVLGAGTATGPGYIFNLGHGVLPETDPAAVSRVVDAVHAWPAHPAG